MSEPSVKRNVSWILADWLNTSAFTGDRLADLAIGEYERTVPSDRLQAILSERRHAVNEITPTGTLEERAESRTCHCGRPILPGQAYAVDGPEHIGCRRQSPRG